MPPPVLAAEPGAGNADEPVAAGISSPPIGELAMAAAAPTAPPTTPAATSPGLKPLLSLPQVDAGRLAAIGFCFENEMRTGGVKGLAGHCLRQHAARFHQPGRRWLGDAHRALQRQGRPPLLGVDEKPVR
jgi:hypothetical protein